MVFPTPWNLEFGNICDSLPQPLPAFFGQCVCLCVIQTQSPACLFVLPGAIIKNKSMLQVHTIQAKNPWKKTYEWCGAVVVSLFCKYLLRSIIWRDTLEVEWNKFWFHPPSHGHPTV